MTIINIINFDGQQTTLDAEEFLSHIDTTILSQFKFIDREGFLDIATRRLTRLRKVTDINKIYEILIEYAQNKLNRHNYEFKFVAAQILLEQITYQSMHNRGVDKPYEDFKGLINLLVERNIFEKELFDSYTEEEIAIFESALEESRDKLFDFIGLNLAQSRYLVRDRDRLLIELPQHRAMIMAMTIMQHEGQVRKFFGKGSMLYSFVKGEFYDREKRVEHVLEAYWAFSNLYYMSATPTLKSSGRWDGQFASCFVDTIDDSLDAIYGSIGDFAQVSKNGAAEGVFLGELRSNGASIRGHKEAASGIMGWVQGLEQVAVTVNQLNQRKGAVSPQLPIWHPDIKAFLDMRKNSGNTQKAFEVFPCVIFPDLFWELEAQSATNHDIEWYTFDPHEVRSKYGWYLNDFYDEVKGDPNGKFRTHYEILKNDKDLKLTKVFKIRDLFRHILQITHETSMPYQFYWDEVNRKNPNNHEGMVLSTNLCTEICQVMSATKYIQNYLNPETFVVETKKQPGRFVTCNLGSISVFRCECDGVLERVIKIAMRCLDNIIDINLYRNPVPQAMLTNIEFRPVGLGTMDWAHHLSHNRIHFESDEAIAESDRFFEDFAFYTIKASMELAKEKGAYPLFKGSDWETSAYLTKRDITDERWIKLFEEIKVHGVRNGHMMAVAPTGSIGQYAGCTEGINPNYKVEYIASKESYKESQILPGYDAQHAMFYASKGPQAKMAGSNANAFAQDQKWIILQNAARQKYIDQAVSMDLHVLNTMKYSELANLYRLAWSTGCKTVYYTRNESLEVLECEFCQ